MIKRRYYAVLLSLAFAGCGSASNAISNGMLHPNSGTGSTPISHVVIIVQENRSFNNLFATFPGATGSTTGLKLVGRGKHAKQVKIALKEVDLAPAKDLNHLYKSFLLGYDNGKMDGFNRIVYKSNGKPENDLPYVYVNPNELGPYWQMASTYGLANQMFQTQGSGSFTAHQDLIRGGTDIDSTHSIIDDPDSSQAWGCIAPPGTVTSLITTSLQYEPAQGPYPCTDKFPSSGSNYETLQTLLDADSISWKYYTPIDKYGKVGALWNAFLAIEAVYGNQTEWKAHISIPETDVLKDIANNALPSVSWVIPDASNSDHPGYQKVDYGPSWVASVVNAVGQSSYWDSSAIIVLWDDWGGFYDPVKPPARDDQGGPGFRVPMIVISPYSRETSASKPGYISNTVYGFGSVVKFVEETFNLPSLNTTDKTSNSIDDMFDFTQQPRSFQVISSQYSGSFFEHQLPSGLPVDTQ